MARRAGRRSLHPQSEAGIAPRFRTGAALAIALIAVFAIKLVVLFQLHEHPLLQPEGGLDSGYYYALAQRVIDGHVLLGPGLYFVSPLYIYFLATALWVGGGSLFFVKVVQIGLGTAACGLVFATARAWFGNRAAWIALALAALAGEFTFYEVTILQAALDPFLTSFDIYLLARAARDDRPGWSIAAGAALGVHALNRPNVLIVAVGLVVLFAIPRPRSWRWTRALALAAGVAIALIPMAARNLAVGDTLSPMPSHGGLNFYIGNNPRADGTYCRVEGITPDIAGQAADARRVAENAEGRPLTDSQVSSYFLREGLSWWRRAPDAAGRLFLRKLGYTLNRAFLTLNYSYPFYRDESSALRVLAIGPLLLVPLGLVGLFAHRLAQRPVPEGFLRWAAFVPLTIISIAAFFVASRYRVPLLIALCAASGAAIDAALAAVAKREFRSLSIAALSVVSLAIVAGWNFHLDEGRAEEETRMAVWLASSGRAVEAESYLARGATGPLAGVAQFRVGQALEAAGDLRDAVRHYTRAADIDPNEPAPRAALARAAGRLGISLAQQDNDREALPLLEQAARLAPDSAPAQLNLAVEYARVGRLADARNAAGQALKLDPNYERARQFLRAVGQ